MDDEIRQLVASAAGDPTSHPDIDAIRSGAHRRHRRRTTLTVGTLLAVLVAASVATGMWVRPSTVHIVSPDTSQLVAFDATSPTSGGGTDFALTAQQLAAQPTRLPDSYQRCHGPTTQDGLTTTRYCGPADNIVLRTGPHPSLDERGQRIQIGSRTAWFERPPDGRGYLTLSDRDSMDDTHYQLEIPRTLTLETAAGILTSIPKVEQATGLR